MMPEGSRDFFIDLLLEHWPRIAAVAWDGWLAWLHTLGGEPTPAASETFPPACGEVTVH
jgi:hypothetical protein